MKKNQKRPLIFDLHHFALDDGPGIRTTVFLKGCPLACIWCQNPESIKSGPEIAFYPQLCINCGDCQTVCREHAIDLKDSERMIRNRCNSCAKCVKECPTTALKLAGKYYSVQKLVEILLGDRIFYQTSKGGVTFSGGEPTLYMDYVAKVMRELKKNNIHIAIETAGTFDLAEFKKKLLPYIDLIFYDIKIFDSRKHKQYTGQDNKQILTNFIELIKIPDIEIIPRIPLIPKITATTENLTRIACFLKDNKCLRYKLLSYNPAGISKRTALGQNIPEQIPQAMMRIEEDQKWRKIFRDRMKY